MLPNKENKSQLHPRNARTNAYHRFSSAEVQPLPHPG